MSVTIFDRDPRRKGRGPKSKEDDSRKSAFTAVFEKKVSVSRNGKQHELTLEEALELKIFNKALEGDIPSIRRVLKMIQKREKWFRKQAAKNETAARDSVIILHEADPKSADDALLLLGLVQPEQDGHGSLLRLQPWAVEAALRRKPDKGELEYHRYEIRISVLNADTIEWPKGV